MAKTDVILIKKVDGLGGEADHATVAAGYARNYLIPQGYAIPMTSANKRRVDSLRDRREKREAEELAHAKELEASLSKMMLTIKAKTGEDGKMFGSVTSKVIADELMSQFELELDRRKIQLPEAIKLAGEHLIDIRLHNDVTASLKVLIEGSVPVSVASE
ncbi:50S ribosomal protein L9 [Verrucomicrobia bacterium]|jgi:large subunit ribosomal protein L9|nr:50S ribosomal protein L9 [Verrucomicrobiota bacterium]MDG1893031.1 50S ribosomal protein L9 [Verrucomicrobiota bacterium]